MRLFVLITLLIVTRSAFAAEDVSFFESIGSNIQSVTDFFVTDIPDFFASLYASFIQYATYARIKMTIWSVQFSYQIAQSLIQELSVTQYLDSALASIPSNIGYYLNILGIPDCIQLIIEAWVTRFVISFRGI